MHDWQLGVCLTACLHGETETAAVDRFFSSAQTIFVSSLSWSLRTHVLRACCTWVQTSQVIHDAVSKQASDYS